jgi:hypothetical protein
MIFLLGSPCDHQALNHVTTRFMRVVQPLRVDGASESSGAMDIAPLDCPPY